MNHYDGNNAPEAEVGSICVHADPGALWVDAPDCRDYVTLKVGRATTVFFNDPLALAVRLRDLAAELESIAMGDAA